MLDSDPFQVMGFVFGPGTMNLFVKILPGVVGMIYLILYFVLPFKAYSSGTRSRLPPPG